MFLVKKTNFKVSEGPSAIDITLIAHSEQADKYSKSEKSEIKIPPVTDRLWAAGRGVLGGVAPRQTSGIVSSLAVEIYNLTHRLTPHRSDNQIRHFYRS